MAKIDFRQRAKYKIGDTVYYFGDAHKVLEVFEREAGSPEYHIQDCVSLIEMLLLESELDDEPVTMA